MALSCLDPCRPDAAAMQDTRGCASPIVAPSRPTAWWFVRARSWPAGLCPGLLCAASSDPPPSISSILGAEPMNVRLALFTQSLQKAVVIAVILKGALAALTAIH